MLRALRLLMMSRSSDSGGIIVTCSQIKPIRIEDLL